MDLSQIPSYASFSCELRIIQARNIEFIKSTKNLFARLYLPAANNKSVKLNSKTKSAPFWNESFNLDCSCSQEFLETLEQQSLVLELRQSNAVLRKIWGSHLVAKGEIPWKTILESPNMELKEWLKMDLVSSGSDNCQDTKLMEPKVEVEIKIRVASVLEMEKENKRRRLNNLNECGCKDRHDHHAWCSNEDYELFALGAALEAF